MPEERSMGELESEDSRREGSPPSKAMEGLPKPTARPFLSSVNFFWSTWEIANSTMNRTMSRVIMSA